MTEKLSASDKRVQDLSVALEDQKKNFVDNSGLLKDLLVGIENLGENLKSINQELDSWSNPEVQEAEREYAEVERQLLAEVPISNPVSAGPSGTNTPPENQHSYPAQRSNLFPVAGLANIPISTEWTEDVEVTALKKPYPGAPTPVNLDVRVCKGFNAGKDGQSKVPQFFV